MTGSYALSADCSSASCVQMTGVSYAAVAGCECTISMRCSVLATSHGVTHVLIALMRTSCVTVRAVCVVMMPMVATIPIDVRCAAMP